MSTSVPTPVPAPRTPTPLSSPAVGSRDAVGFVLRLGRALHNAGFSARRVEATLSDATTKLGIEAQFFSTPTSMMAAFGPPNSQSTHLIRAETESKHLSHRSGLDPIARDVMYGSLGPIEGTQRIEALLAEPLYWTTRATLVAEQDFQSGCAE